MKQLVDLGAQVVAGRCIHAGKDLAFFSTNSQTWEITPAGEEFIAARSTVVDGVEVQAPAERRSRRKPVPVEDVTDVLPDLSGLGE